MSRRRLLGGKRGEAVVVVQPNTFIGGVAATITSKELLADKLVNHPSGSAFSPANILNFTIIGNEIQCYISVEYQVAISAFFNNTEITKYIDDGGYCKKLNVNAFWINVGIGNLERIKFEGVVTADGSCFRKQSKLKILNFKNLTNITSGNSFLSGISDAVLYAPNLVPLAETIGNDSLFLNTSGIKLYANAAIQTNNGGSPDGDISTLISNGGAVSYIQNYTKPNNITDLTIGNVYGTAIQLNFTEPIGSTNAIDFYECYVNGSYNGIIESGGYAKNLNPTTPYDIEVKPIDIYYNKSSSNIITQTTMVAEGYPVSNIISYQKMENNVLDSFGKNDGTATDVAYEAGKSGNAAVFNGSTSRVLLNNSAPYNITKGSLSCFIKTSTPGSGFRGIIGKQNAYQMFLNSNVLGFYSYSAPSGFKSTGVSLNDGLWHHVIMTFNSGVTNGTKIYLDRVLVLTDTLAISNQTVEAVIGGAGTIQKINAVIDGAAYWSDVLTQAEAEAVYDKQNAGLELI